MLEGWIIASAKGSRPTRPEAISALMSRSESSTDAGYRFAPLQREGRHNLHLMAFAFGLDIPQPTAYWHNRHVPRV